MKTYLSNEERQVSTFFSICYGLIEKTLAERVNYISKEEIKNLKYARTYLEKYIISLVKRVGVKEGDRVYRLARDSQVELKPRDYDGQFVVDKESLEYVCAIAVDNKCFGCTRTDWHNCGLYRCQEKMGVGSVNDTEGKCEFWYDER